MCTAWSRRSTVAVAVALAAFDGEGGTQRTVPSLSPIEVTSRATPWRHACPLRGQTAVGEASSGQFAAARVPGVREGADAPVHRVGAHGAAVSGGQ